MYQSADAIREGTASIHMRNHGRSGRANKHHTVTALIRHSTPATSVPAPENDETVFRDGSSRNAWFKRLPLLTHRLLLLLLLLHLLRCNSVALLAVTTHE